MDRTFSWIKNFLQEKGAGRIQNGESLLHPESVEKYLESKFGDALDAVSDAIRKLAKSLPPSQLSQKACTLCEKFRPEIPPGKKGCGPPASWTWTSSARWLRSDPQEPSMKEKLILM